jgi:hypothetical protein
VAAIVRLNPRFETELVGSQAVGGPLDRLLADRAGAVVRNAQGIGRGEFYRRGGYVRGIKAETGLDEQGRLVGRVNANKFTSHWAERGWARHAGGSRARHILARAAAQAGLKVVAGGPATTMFGPLGKR